jgi:hypothetical protein
VRALKILGWVLAGLELLYLVGANVFLNCNLLPIAFNGTSQVRATVASGWSLIPERVHVHHVRFIFQDHNLQFAIELDSAFLVVHLSELLHHTFHGSHLHGEGVSFRMRHRIDPWSKNEPAVGAFAPIPELNAPAVFEAYVPEAPISDAKYDLWTIHLDDGLAPRRWSSSRGYCQPVAIRLRKACMGRSSARCIRSMCACPKAWPYSVTSPRTFAWLRPIWIRKFTRCSRQRTALESRPPEARSSSTSRRSMASSPGTATC